MSYENNQKDLVVMQHLIDYELHNKKYRVNSSLVFAGQERYSAMALTVGLPVAFVTELILEKKLRGKGVMIPITKEFYKPILEKLAKKGISFKETVVEK